MLIGVSVNLYCKYDLEQKEEIAHRREVAYEEGACHREFLYIFAYSSKVYADEMLSSTMFFQGLKKESICIIVTSWK